MATDSFKAIEKLETDLWEAADNLRANSKLTSSGATVDRIPIETFPNFPARFPRLDLQKRIAEILGAYDDLIENNRRRLALLEEAARQLYREWFVRLRFPGHEHTRVSDGVPEGWETKTLGNLCIVREDQTLLPQGWNRIHRRRGFVRRDSMRSLFLLLGHSAPSMTPSKR